MVIFWFLCPNDFLKKSISLLRKKNKVVLDCNIQLTSLRQKPFIYFHVYILCKNSIHISLKCLVRLSYCCCCCCFNKSTIALRKKQGCKFTRDCEPDENVFVLVVIYLSTHFSPSKVIAIFKKQNIAYKILI